MVSCFLLIAAGALCRPPVATAETWTTYRASRLDIPTSVLVDRNGTVWTGTCGGGVHAFNGTS